MIKLEHSVIIDKPLRDVWEFLSNPENNPQWQSGVVESGPTSDGPIGVGTHVLLVRQFLGQRVETVFVTTEFDPNRKFAFRSIKGPMSLAGSISVEPVGRGTKVSYSGHGKLGRVFRFGEPIIARMLRRQARDDFEALKKLLESR